MGHRTKYPWGKSHLPELIQCYDLAFQNCVQRTNTYFELAMAMRQPGFLSVCYTIHNTSDWYFLYSYLRRVKLSAKQ
jgi:hypothetical protein